MMIEKPNRCVACGGSQFEKMSVDDTFHKAKFSIYRCVSCGIGMLYPLPSFRELEKLYYNEDYHAYQSAGAHGSSRRMKDIVKRAVLDTYFGYGKPSFLGHLFYPFYFRLLTYPERREVGSYLDVGCGSGVKLLHMQALGWKVTGVDLSERALEIARSNGITDLHAGMLGDARFPDAMFDVVNLTHVLEHLPNPAETFVEIHRILKEGGEVIIAVPNFDGLGNRMFGARSNYDVPRHFYQFNSKSICILLEHNGFDVETIYCNDIFRGFGHSLFFALHLPEWTQKYFVMAGLAIDLLAEPFLARTSLGSQMIVKAKKR